MTILYLWIWFAGVILSWPRVVASFYQIDEDYIHALPPDHCWFEFFVSLFSWVSVFTGIVVYYQEKEKYFWKWSKKKLWERYNSNQTAID